MTAAKQRLILTALIAAMLAAFAPAAVAPRDAGAAAASNPRILGVALVAGNRAKVATVVVYNATGSVAICISGKCRPMEKASAGIWTVGALRPLPTLVRGQRRKVIVVATAKGGSFSIYQKTVTVR